jgi:hypothetical protein
MVSGKIQRSFSSLLKVITLEDARHLRDLLLATVAALLVMVAALLVTVAALHLVMGVAHPRDLLAMVVALPKHLLTIVVALLLVLLVALLQAVQATVGLPVLLLLLVPMPLPQVCATPCAAEPTFMAWAMLGEVGVMNKEAVLPWVACKADPQ